jgi:biotin carboxylase
MMQNSCVLILGAGLMQKPSIEAAKALGYKAVVVDANPHAVCVPFADRFEPIDLKNKDAVLALAQSLGSDLAGVFTAGTDFSTTVSYVAEKCHLPKQHSYQAALNASDKIAMRTCFKEAAVPSPHFTQISRTEIASFIASGKLDELTFPSVVKPVDNMGARGCRMIRSKEEFLPAVEEAVRASRSGRAILEDYMMGSEYSIDAVVYHDTLTITGFADRHIFYEPYFIEMGHTMPTSADENVKAELIACFARGIKALGLTNGVAKADIKYTEKGPMIGEIAARLSGGYMSGWTYPYASSLNLTKQALLIATGREPEDLLQHRRPLAIHDVPFGIYEVPCQQVSAERAWLSVPGIVKKVYGADQATAVPFVQNTFLRAKEGSEVVFPRNNVEKCGNAISRAPTRELAVNASQTCAASFVLRLEAPNQETDAFLAGKVLKSEKGFPPSLFTLEETLRQNFVASLSSLPDIEQDSPVLSQLPSVLESVADSLEDCNHRSLKQTLRLFDQICPQHPVLNAKRFWSALIRGGIQGALYVADDTSFQLEQKTARHSRRNK